MAVIVYTCDTCKREIELPQNIEGLEVMSRCIITNGCKGKLVKTAVKTSHIKGKLPDPDPTGLQDWFARRTYFKTEQKSQISKWKVRHNFGTNPSVQVHIRTINGTLRETFDYQVVYKNPLELEIIFPEPKSGVVQCFARSSVTDEKHEIISFRPSTKTLFVTISGGNVLSFAAPENIELDKFKLGFISATTNSIVYFEQINFTDQTSSLSPWWKQTTEGFVTVFFFGRRWNVLTTRIDDDILIRPEIVDGSSFFITYKKTYQIIEVNYDAKTIKVSGKVDLPSLPFKKLFVGQHSYDIVNVLYNQTSNTTLIGLLNEIGEITHENIIIDCPVDFPMFVLLSNEPHTTVDKDIHHAISVKELSYKNAVSFQTLQKRGTLFVEEWLKQTIFPPIVV